MKKTLQIIVLSTVVAVAVNLTFRYTVSQFKQNEFERKRAYQIEMLRKDYSPELREWFREYD